MHTLRTPAGSAPAAPRSFASSASSISMNPRSNGALWMISSQPRNEAEQLLGDLGKLRRRQQPLARNAVHGARALVDLALRIQVAVEMPATGSAIEQLDAADFYDAVAALGFQAGGFGIENDLSHGVG